MLNEPLVMSDELCNAVTRYLQNKNKTKNENPQDVIGLTQVIQGLSNLQSLADEYKDVLIAAKTQLANIQAETALLEALNKPYYDKIVEIATKELVGKLILHTHYGSNVIFCSKVEVDSNYIRAVGRVFAVHELRYEKTYKNELSSYGVFDLTSFDYRHSPHCRLIDSQYLNKMLDNKFNSIRLDVNNDCCNLANKL